MADHACGYNRQPVDPNWSTEQKQYERLGKIEEKIDPLGNRVTALEARVGGLERVWSSKAEDRP